MQGEVSTEWWYPFACDSFILSEIKNEGYFGVAFGSEISKN